MNRSYLLVVGLLLVFAALVVRDYFIKQEISTEQAQLREQIEQNFESANSMERLQHLSASMLVYNRYLDPVIETAQRLVWPFARLEIIQDWKRDVHSSIEMHIEDKKAEFIKEAGDKISAVQTSQKASLDRLEEIAKLSNNLASDSERIEAIRNEIDALRLATKQADLELIAKIKELGKTRIKELKRIIKEMDEAALFDFVTSGDMYSIVQQPVADKILEIRQSDLRARTWQEFNKNVGRILSAEADIIVGRAGPAVRMKNLMKKFEEAPTGGISMQMDVSKPIIIKDPANETPENPSASNLPRVE